MHAEGLNSITHSVIGAAIDLVVARVIPVELKAVERLLPVHDAQLLTYLKLLNMPLGLIINFNVPHLVSGVKRIANRF